MNLNGVSNKGCKYEMPTCDIQTFVITQIPEIIHVSSAKYPIISSKFSNLSSCQSSSDNYSWELPAHIFTKYRAIMYDIFMGSVLEKKLYFNNTKSIFISVIHDSFCGFVVGKFQINCIYYKYLVLYWQ